MMWCITNVNSQCALPMYRFSRLTFFMTMPRISAMSSLPSLFTSILPKPFSNAASSNYLPGYFFSMIVLTHVRKSFLDNWLLGLACEPCMPLKTRLATLSTFWSVKVRLERGSGRMSFLKGSSPPKYSVIVHCLCRAFCLCILVTLSLCRLGKVVWVWILFLI